MPKHGPLAWLAVAAVVLLAVISTADAQQLAVAPRKRTMRPARGAARVSRAVAMHEGCLRCNRCGGGRGSGGSGCGSGGSGCGTAAPFDRS